MKIKIHKNINEGACRGSSFSIFADRHVKLNRTTSRAKYLVLTCWYTTAQPYDSGTKKEPADNAGSYFYINKLHAKKHRDKIRRPMPTKFIERQINGMLLILLSYHVGLLFVKRYVASLNKTEKERVREDGRREGLAA
jgi:hypothetical protein